MSKKKIILIILIVFSPFILFGLVHLHAFICFTYLDYLPMPEYQKRIEPIDPLAVCKKIKDSQSNELCLTVVGDNDFEKGLDLVSKVKKYSLEDYPWYDFPFYSSPRYNYSPWGLEWILTEGKNHNPGWWCKEVYSPKSYFREDYFFCRAFLENPHFCDKIPYLIGSSKGICYQDAAFIWKDTSLCQKAEYPDFCYLRLVLKNLED